MIFLMFINTLNRVMYCMEFRNCYDYLQFFSYVMYGRLGVLVVFFYVDIFLLF